MTSPALASIIPGAPVAAILWIALIIVGAGGAALSFSRRWGRSRWPFHVVISTAIAGLALGRLLETTEARSFEWLGLTLAIFAVARALMATFKEPGPRF